MKHTFFQVAPRWDRRVAAWLAAVCALALALGGCNESTPPVTGSPDGGAEFDAALDPSGSSFVLKRIESPLPGREFVRIELVGSNVRIDPNSETVSLDVALRNASDHTLHTPAVVWLHRFVPRTVVPINADLERGDGDGVEPDSSIVSPIRAWGFDYSALLGDDGVLSPGETSGRKTWSFHDPGLVSFAFAAVAHFGMQPDRPHVSGMVFHDENRNGQRDRGEGPFPGGVTMTTPDGAHFMTHVGADGRYAFPVESPGLYQLRYFSILRDGEPDPMPPHPPLPRIVVCVTTPNPLEVILVAGPDGEPVSFEHADFGVVPGPCDIVPPVLPLLVMTDLRPEDIEQDHYSLMDAKLEGDVLTLQVGFSGCSPDHPFTLYASRGFMESNPVQTWSLLAHDDRGELCDAWFGRTLQFDLGPLRAEHIRAYGRPGVVILRFRDFNGQERRFEFGP